MERVGKEGVITVNDGKTLDNELDVVEGMKFDRGYISPYFATDPKTQVFDVEDPLILLVEKKVSSIQSIVPLLETVVKAQRPLLVVAEDVESEALATLVVNKLRAGIKVCAVKAPGFGDNRRETLQDLAALTGATVVSDDVGLKLEQATLDHLGSCKKCTVSKDDTIVLDGGGERADVEARCDTIRDLIAASKSDYEREKLQERLAKLGGGVAASRFNQLLHQPPEPREQLLGHPDIILAQRRVELVQGRHLVRRRDDGLQIGRDGIAQLRVGVVWLEAERDAQDHPQC